MKLKHVCFAIIHTGLKVADDSDKTSFDGTMFQPLTGLEEQTWLE